MGYTSKYHRHLVSGEMKAQIVLSCTSHIEDRGLDSNNADCKEFILILLIGSQQVPHGNNFAWTSLCLSPQQNAGVIAAHDNIPVPALISLTPLSEAAERLKHTSGSETLYSDCQCDLRRFYLPGWLDEARTGLLTCLPLHLACYADVCLVLKDCLFILDFGIFSTGLNASDVCWLCVGGGGGRKRQVLSFGNLRQNFHVGLASWKIST